MTSWWRRRRRNRDEWDNPDESVDGVPPGPDPASGKDEPAPEAPDPNTANPNIPSSATPSSGSPGSGTPASDHPGASVSSSGVSGSGVSGPDAPSSDQSVMEVPELDHGGSDPTAWVRPLSLLRIERKIQSLGFKCEIDMETASVDGVWNGVPVSFVYDPGNEDWLRVRSRWHLPDEYMVLDAERAEQAAMEAANEWNRQYLQPTAYGAARQSGVSVDLDFVAFVRHGMSERQLGEVIDRALQTTLQANSTLPVLLPPPW